MRAREVMSDVGPESYADECRALARRTGSLLTRGEYAELTGERVVEVKVVTYRFRPGGRILPPVDVVVRCRPAALDGVYRSMAKLMESRGWVADASVDRDRVPEREIGACDEHEG